MRCLVTVAVLAAAALSGCLGGDDFDPDLVNSNLINDARDELGEDAALYGIMGMEPGETIPADETEGCGTIPRDANPGDGKAPVWMFFYATPANDQAMFIITDRNGDVRCDQTTSSFERPATPLESWDVSAEQAAETIRDQVDGFQDQVQGNTVQMVLESTPDGPKWSFAMIDTETYDSKVWGVHAITGEYLGEHVDTLPDLYSAEEKIPVETGEEEGTTTGTVVVSAIVPAEFKLRYDDHQVLDLVVTSDDPLAELGREYQVRVTHPDGEDEDLFTTNGETIPIEHPQKGTYTIWVFPAAAAHASFIVDYCAYSDSNEACGE